MDIDCFIRKDEPDLITETSTAEAVCLYDKWKRSNCLSVMLIKTKISIGIRVTPIPEGRNFGLFFLNSACEQ